MEEYDDLVASASDYRAEIKALSGVDIMQDETTYKSTYEIIKEIAEVWDTMDDTSQAALLEDLAGKRNTNVVLSMITNIKDLTGAYEDASTAAGTASEANDIYMDTITGKVKQLSAAFESFSYNFLDSSLVKGVVDSATSLLEVLDKLIDRLGSLGTIGFGTAIITLMNKLPQIITLMQVFAGSATALSSVGSFTGYGGGILGFFTALRGALTSTQLAAVGVGTAIAAIGLISTAYNNHIQKQIDANVEVMDKADETTSKYEDSRDAYEAFNDANKAYDGTAESKATLESAATTLATSLGYEADEVDNLTAKYGSLNQAMQAINAESVSESLQNSIDAYNAAYDNLSKKDFKDYFLEEVMGRGSNYTIPSPNLDNDDNAVQQKYEKIYDDLDWSTLYIDDTDDLINAYRTVSSIVDELEQGVEDDLYTSTELNNDAAYQNLKDFISKYESEMDSLFQYEEEVNQFSAQSIYNSYVKENPSKSGAELYNAIASALLDAADAGNVFIGTQDDINDDINTFMKSITGIDNYLDYMDVFQDIEDGYSDVSDALSVFKDDEGKLDTSILSQMQNAIGHVYTGASSFFAKNSGYDSWVLGGDTYKNAYAALDAAAHEHGVTVMELINILSELGLVEVETADDGQSAADTVTESASKMAEAVKTLAETTKQLKDAASEVYTYGTMSSDTAIDFIDTLTEDLDDDTTGVQSYLDQTGMHISDFLTADSNGNLATNSKGWETYTASLYQDEVDAIQAQIDALQEKRDNLDLSDYADRKLDYEYGQEINALTADLAVYNAVIEEAANGTQEFYDSIDSNVGDLQTLQDALRDYYSGTLTDDEVLDLMMKFPQLTEYSNNLATGIRACMDSLLVDTSNPNSVFSLIDAQIEAAGDDQDKVDALLKLKSNIERAYSSDNDYDTERGGIASAIDDAVSSASDLLELLQDVNDELNDNGAISVDTAQSLMEQLLEERDEYNGKNYLEYSGTSLADYFTVDNGVLTPDMSAWAEYQEDFLNQQLADTKARLRQTVIGSDEYKQYSAEIEIYEAMIGEIEADFDGLQEKFDEGLSMDETFDDIIDQMETGGASLSDVMGWIEEYPQLAPYVDELLTGSEDIADVLHDIETEELQEKLDAVNHTLETNPNLSSQQTEQLQAQAKAYEYLINMATDYEDIISDFDDSLDMASTFSDIETAIRDGEDISIEDAMGWIDEYPQLAQYFDEIISGATSMSEVLDQIKKEEYAQKIQEIDDALNSDTPMSDEYRANLEARKKAYQYLLNVEEEYADLAEDFQNDISEASSYDELLESLETGGMSMEDALGWIEEFPELAPWFDELMNGAEGLDNVINAMRIEDYEKRIAAINNELENNSSLTNIQRANLEAQAEAYQKMIDSLLITDKYARVVGQDLQTDYTDSLTDMLSAVSTAENVSLDDLEASVQTIDVTLDVDTQVAAENVDGNEAWASSLQDVAESATEAENSIQEFETSTQFGNVDLSDLPSITWNEDALSKYQKAYESFGVYADDLAGSTSTLMPEKMEYDAGTILYTPIFKVDGETSMMSLTEAHDYLRGIMEEALSDGVVTEDELLGLDTEGIILGFYDTMDAADEAAGAAAGLASEFEADSEAAEDVSSSADGIADSVESASEEAGALGDSLNNGASSAEDAAATYTAAGQSIIDTTTAAGKALQEFVDSHPELELELTTIEGVTEAIDEYSKSIKTSNVKQMLKNLWNSDEFEDARSDLESTAKEAGITAADIMDLADDNEYLAYMMEESGVSATYLAEMFQRLSTEGSSAFENITSDALELDSVLNQMDAPIAAANTALQNYSNSYGSWDYDDQYEEYADAWNNWFEGAYGQDYESYINGDAAESVGEFGADFWRGVELFMGEGHGADDIASVAATMNQIGNWFTGDDNGLSFISDLYDNIGSLKDASNGLIDVWQNSDGSFGYNIDTLTDADQNGWADSIEAIAKQFGATNEVVAACLESLGMWGDYSEYTAEQLETAFGNTSLGIEDANGKIVATTDGVRSQLEELGLESWQIDQVLADLDENENVELFDLSNAQQAAAYCEKVASALHDTTTDSINVYDLYDQLIDAGFSDEDAQSHIQTLIDDTNTDYNITGYNGKEITSDMFGDQTASAREFTETLTDLGERAAQAQEYINEAKHTDYSFDKDVDSVTDLNRRIKALNSLIEDAHVSGDTELESAYRQQLKYYQSLAGDFSSGQYVNIDTASFQESGSRQLASMLSTYQSIVRQYGAASEEAAAYKSDITAYATSLGDVPDEVTTAIGVEVDDDASPEEVIDEVTSAIDNEEVDLEVTTDTTELLQNISEASQAIADFLEDGELKISVTGVDTAITDIDTLSTSMESLQDDSPVSLTVSMNDDSNATTTLSRNAQQLQAITKNGNDWKITVTADTEDASDDLDGIISQLDTINGGATANVTVNQSYTPNTSGLTKQVAAVKNQSYTVTAKADTSKATGKITSLASTTAAAAKSRVVTITANVNSALANIQKVIQKIAQVRDKTVTITTKNVVNGTTGTVNGTAHIRGTAYASGTWGKTSGGVSLIGELGSELVVLGSYFAWEHAYKIY